MAKKKDKVPVGILVVAMICITILECYALHEGINGVLFSAVIAALAGLAGWSAPQLKLFSKK